MGALRIRRR